jgi:hypothetical protein
MKTSVNSARIAVLSILLVTLLQMIGYGVPKHPESLYRVRKIFLAVEEGPNDPTTKARYDRMRRLLSGELRKFGFSVVTTAEMDDARLTTLMGDVVTVDGPQPNPPEFEYRFELTTGEDQVVWRTAFTIASKADKAETDNRAAGKAVKALFEAWRKSARKAGVRVEGETVPVGESMRMVLHTGNRLFDPVPAQLRAHLKKRLRAFTQCIVARDTERLNTLIDPRSRAALEATASKVESEELEPEREVLALWPRQIEAVEGEGARYYRITMELRVRDVGSGSDAERRDCGTIIAVYEGGDWYFSPLITFGFIL